MKIIEALKKIKDLNRKADDIRSKISQNCADLDAETPAYGTVEAQSKQIAEWLQAHSDLVKEIERLRLCIQKTNLAVEVTVEVEDGKYVTKSIAAWIHRRKDLAATEMAAWRGLTSRALTPKNYKPDPLKDEVKIANIRKYYDQKNRDRMVEIYTSEPSRIDGSLEITNATTDLIQ